MSSRTEEGRHDDARDDDGEPRPAAMGLCASIVEDGAVRGVRFGGVEVLRQIDYPIRDADWRTLAVEEIAAERRAGARPAPALSHPRRRVRRAASRSTSAEDGDAARLEARLELTSPQRDVEVNRAGFVLLHPIAGVVGRAARGHASGRRRASRALSGADLARPAGLRHRRAAPRGRAASRWRSRWRARSSRWRTSATGPTPRSRPTAGRWRGRVPSGWRPARWCASAIVVTLRPAARPRRPPRPRRRRRRGRGARDHAGA